MTARAIAERLINGLNGHGKAEPHPLSDTWREHGRVAAKGDLTADPSDLDQLQPQPEGLSDGLHAGELRVPTVFDVADRAGIGNPRPFRYRVPGEALRLPGRDTLGGRL